MQCHNCKTENLKNAKFCINCGTPIAIVCPKCNKANLPDTEICSECETKLQRKSPEIPKEFAKKIELEKEKLKGTRRKIAVLFADISGFTSLCEKLDPEEVTNLMNSVFDKFSEIIYKYEGYIDKYIGDCVMVLLGAPVSHEDDPLRAILCGIDLMRSVRDFESMKLSIGISFGEVLAGSIGSGKKIDYTVMGDIVNIAQRLQSAAGTDEIYVSKEIYELTKNEIEYNELEPVKIKGKEKPVIPYKPVSIKSKYVLRRVKESPMVGREVEFNRLLEIYKLTKSGKGQLITITGEPGIGKSKLIYEFTNHIINTDTGDIPLILETRGIEYLQNTEYLVLKNLIWQLIGISESETPLIKSKKIDNFLMPFKEKPQLFGEMLKWLLGGELSEGLALAVEKLTYEDKANILQYGTSLILQSLSKHKNMMLIIDDFQWIDSPSKKFIEIFVQYAGQFRILLILIQRPGSKIFTTQKIQNYMEQTAVTVTELYINPLQEKEEENLAKTLTNTNKIGPKLKKMLTERSGGNPFYLEEFVIMLLSDKMIEIKNDCAELKTQKLEIIPTKLSELILTQFDKLDTELKNILEIASVIGKEFSTNILENFIDINLKTYLRTLENKGIIENITEDFGKILTGDETYTFKHIIIRDTIYETLLKSIRRSYHKKAGETIEKVYKSNIDSYFDLLVHHFRLGEEKEKLLAYLDKFAKKEEKAGNYKKAEELYTEYINIQGENDKDEKFLNFLVKLAVVKNLLAKYDEAIRILDRIEKHNKGLNQLLIKVMIIRSVILRSTGKYNDAMEINKKAKDLAEKIENIDKELLGECYNIMGTISYDKGNYDSALKYYEQALETISPMFGKNHTRIAMSYNSIGNVYYVKGDYEDSLKYYKQALKVWQVNLGENHPYVAISHNNIGDVYYAKNDYDDALKYYEQALKIRCNAFWENHPDIAISYNNIGETYYTKGDYNKALEYYIRAFKIWEVILGENHPYMAISHSNIGDVYYARSDCSKSIECYNKALKIWHTALGENHPDTSYAYHDIAKVYYKLAELKKAFDYAEKALNIRIKSLGEQNKNTGKTKLLFAKILIALNRNTEAKTYLDSAITIGRKYNTEWLKEAEELRKTNSL